MMCDTSKFKVMFVCLIFLLKPQQFNFFQAELIVHKKKVAEVRSWLLDHLTFKKVRRS